MKIKFLLYLDMWVKLQYWIYIASLSIWHKSPCDNVWVLQCVGRCMLSFILSTEDSSKGAFCSQQANFTMIFMLIEIKVRKLLVVFEDICITYDSRKGKGVSVVVLGVYRYLYTRVRYVIHGRVPRYPISRYCSIQFNTMGTKDTCPALRHYLVVSFLTILQIWRGKVSGKRHFHDFLWWCQLICWFCSKEYVVLNAITESIVISWYKNAQLLFAYIVLGYSTKWTHSRISTSPSGYLGIFYQA